MKANFSLTTFFFAALFAVFSMQSCSNAKPIEPFELEGYWILKTMHGQDAKILFSGALPTLKFDFDNMQISGTGGCNRYNGDFTFEKNVLNAPNIASSNMLCFDENAEPQFLMELAKENKISIVNGVLTLTNRDKEVVFEFEKGEAIDETPSVITSEMLQGQWILKRLEGMEADAIFKGEDAIVPTLIIDAVDGRVTGNAGCNNYNAPFSLQDDMFILSPVIGTKMTCPNIDGEVKYLKIFEDTLTVSLPNPDVLLFVKNDQAVLEFEKNQE